MSNWNHLMCDGCWSDRHPHREPNRLLEPETEPCCFCGTPTTSGIWMRGNPNELSCKHCMYPDCGELAKAGAINDADVCMKHIDWAMGNAVKPLHKALKESGL